MRTPREIYAAYDIMGILQLHQVRVAAVGKTVCDHFKKSVSARDVVLACLFHDMGNILKFDLSSFPESLEPQGSTYWEEVKARYEATYGTNEHAATEAIAREIGLSERVIGLINAINFSGLAAVLASDEYEQKIVEYADCRVAPLGVTSMRERFAEGRARYRKRFKSAEAHEAHFDQLTEAGYAIEQQLFARCDIAPDDITETLITPLMQELWEYPVS